MADGALIHAGTAERWPTLELVDQLANVGSEVERAIRAHASGNAGSTRRRGRSSCST